MKSTHVAILVLGLCLALHLQAQNANNPIETALLRWYQANVVATFSPCAEPEGLAFDGENIWVACGAAQGGGNELVALAASEGNQVRISGTVADPYALVYDGEHVWASSPNNDKAYEVLAQTGEVLNTVTVQTRPMGIAFDGRYVWVANNSPSSNSLSQIDPLNPTSSTSYGLGSGCAQPWGLAFDGTYLWVACNTSNSVVRFDPSRHSITATVPNIPFPAFVAYDGTNIWATSNIASGNAYYFPANNPPTTTPPKSAVGNTPYGVAFDTQYIWVANGGGTSSNVTKILASTGTVVSNYTSSQTGALNSTFVAFDGGNIWISNTAGGTVSKF